MSYVLLFQVKPKEAFLKKYCNPKKIQGLELQLIRTYGRQILEVCLDYFLFTAFCFGTVYLQYTTITLFIYPVGAHLVQTIINNFSLLFVLVTYMSMRYIWANDTTEHIYEQIINWTDLQNILPPSVLADNVIAILSKTTFYRNI